MSEHPPGTSPLKGHFLRRNRIVATLSRATVVVEAHLTSGARNTARSALQEGRDVLAVPGPVDRESHAGCHLLLREGATLVRGPWMHVFRVLGGGAARPGPAAAGRAPGPDRRRRGPTSWCGTRSTGGMRCSTPTRRSA